MYMILRYPTGVNVDAVLLSATRDRLRVMVRDQEDTLDLRLIGSRWISDQGSAVEIESLLVDDPNAVARIWHETSPLVAGAAF